MNLFFMFATEKETPYHFILQMELMLLVMATVLPGKKRKGTR